MKLINKVTKAIFLSLIILTCCWQRVYAQGSQWLGYSGDLIWLRINSLHAYVSELGSEMETAGDCPRTIRFSWPGEYGLDQAAMRANGIWLGCTDYYDSKVNKQFSYMISNSGLKPGEYTPRPWGDAIEFKLIGRFEHPQVYVDDQPATINALYDILDEVDETMLADRMVICTNHTSIGVTVSKRMYIFTQQNHDNYYIYHYKLTNTGIIDNDSTMNPQTINNFYFNCLYRYGVGGEAITETGATTGRNWASAYAAWGRNTVNDVIGTDPATSDFEMRAVFAWYGPDSERPVPLEDDWGCPNEKDDGIMANARYIGHVAVHADKSVSDRSDDPYQPRTTQYLETDNNLTQRQPSQYDETYIIGRYNLMQIGHAPMTHAELIEASGLAANDWAKANGDAVSGVTSVQGFGPYTLEPDSSVNVVIAGCIAGLSREKNREVSGNWLEYYNGTGTPELTLPDGSTTTNHTEYKKAWVLTAKDSLLQTFRRAIENYESGFNIPQPPPPPETFSVHSGGDRISLSWAENATAYPNFDGYVIFRSEGSVMDPLTVYEKLWECDGSNVVHEFDDMTAVRGFDYYYYIQSKTNGANNNGVPLYSGKFWTMTSIAANLQRPAVPETPTAPADDSNAWGEMSSQGEWIASSDYNIYDAISYNNLTYICIVTHLGDTVTTTPDLNTTNWRVTAFKGEWVSGNGYNAYDIVTYNGFTYVCLTTIPAGIGLELVRVVPNPYNIRARAFQYGEDFQVDRISFFGLPGVCTVKVFTERGDLIYEKYHDDGSGDEIWNSLTSSGQIVVSGIYILYVETPDGRSVIRKFVVIR